MKCLFRITCIIPILVTIVLLSSCDLSEGDLKIINHYHQSIIRFGLREDCGRNIMHDVNIMQGESHIHTRVPGRNRLFVITKDNMASNFIPFYVGRRMTVTITLDEDGVLAINQ